MAERNKKRITEAIKMIVLNENGLRGLSGCSVSVKSKLRFIESEKVINCQVVLATENERTEFPSAKFTLDDLNRYINPPITVDTMRRLCGCENETDI